MKRRRKRYPGRLIVCPRCKETKNHRARGLCTACYVKYQRNGILHRAGPLGERYWKSADLSRLRALRTAGLTVRECCVHFPGRTYWGVRLACVSRGFTRPKSRLEYFIQKREGEKDR